MTSLIARLHASDKLVNWRLLRASGEELRAVDDFLVGHADRMESEYGSTTIDIFADENILVVVEPEPLCPALFHVHGERFTIGLADLDKVQSELVAFGVRLDQPKRSTEGNGIRNVIENLWKLWEQRCRCRALECIQAEHRFDREGADFFDAIEQRLRSLFAPDYLEIAPVNSSTYWPDRPEGWSWIFASRSEFQWPSPLSQDYEEGLFRKGSTEFVAELSEREMPLFAANQASGLTSGLFVPLVHRGQRHGIIKLLFARRPLISTSEESSLPTVQHGLSLVFDRSALHFRTQRMAMVDGLTNLFNHRFFLTQLRTEYQRSLRYGGVISLLMIDVDGFKNYNDTYGHQAGNRVLTWVASMIRRTVRDIDVVARYGGEEFALILPEVRAEQGLIVAEKIRKVISSGEIVADTGEKLAPITISCGVTDSAGCKSPEDMIDRADRALYWVKRNGRNLVRLATLE